MRTLLLSGLLLATGCTHPRSVQVPEADDLSRFNGYAADKTATVTLQSGKTYPARAIQLTPDSTSWLVPKSNAVFSVPTHDVADVRFLNHGRGALDGLGLGAVVGGVSGAALGLLSGDDPPCDEGWCFFRMTAGDKAAMAGIGLGFVFGLVGLVAGGVSGSEEVYSIDDQFRKDGALGQQPAATGSTTTGSTTTGSPTTGSTANERPPTGILDG